MKNFQFRGRAKRWALFVLLPGLLTGACGEEQFVSDAGSQDRAQLHDREDPDRFSNDALGDRSGERNGDSFGDSGGNRGGDAFGDTGAERPGDALADIGSGLNPDDPAIDGPQTNLPNPGATSFRAFFNCSDRMAEAHRTSLLSAGNNVEAHLLPVIQGERVEIPTADLNNQLMPGKFLAAPLVVQDGTYDLILCDSRTGCTVPNRTPDEEGAQQQNSILSALTNPFPKPGNEAGRLGWSTQSFQVVNGEVVNGAPQLNVLYDEKDGRGERLCDRSASPLVIDLDGDGLYFSSLEDGVAFDIDASGDLEQVAWTQSADDRFLVWDRNGNGVVDDASELFGNNTAAGLLENSATAANGFEALRALDANGDGVVDASDPLFDSLQLWSDSDHNGISAEDELEQASDWVHYLRVDYQDIAAQDQHGNTAGQLGSAGHVDGGERDVVDIWFHFED